jgi:hypothetical protein
MSLDTLAVFIAIVLAVIAMAPIPQGKIVLLGIAIILLALVNIHV